MSATIFPLPIHQRRTISDELLRTLLTEMVLQRRALHLIAKDHGVGRATLVRIADGEYQPERVAEIMSSLTGEQA